VGAMEEKDWDDEECDDTLTMTTVSRHCFGGDSETPSFSISIIEVLHFPTAPHTPQFPNQLTVTLLLLFPWLQRRT